MANKNQQYAELYAEYAMQQMKLYGIPASVTLAQGILESANGQSRLARNENNHFGIKATPSWINNGGKYGLYTDDKPDEKFCSYDSVGDSYTHHSRFLKENARYASCFQLAADDYKGWAQGLERAGYATSASYASALISIIEQNDLQKYDRMVMAEMKTDKAKLRSSERLPEAEYSFPLERKEFLFITSPFGMRQDPSNPTGQQMHKGIDIRCDNEAVLATEKGGKVVAVNDNANTAGGKSVVIEYGREDGSRIQASYLHMDTVTVKVGDKVDAGQTIGVSGNTGNRTTGSHLHFGIRQIAADGSSRDVDPAAYLADIAQKGNLRQTAMYNGKDLLEKYRMEQPERPGTADSLTAGDWMKKLLTSEDSGIGPAGYGQDPVVEMIMTMFTSLMALALQIDGKDEEEQMALATETALNRRIDLTALVPALKECFLTAGDGHTPVLHTSDGTNRYDHPITRADLNRLNLVMTDSTLDDEAKRQRVATVINRIILTDSMSQEYRQGITRSQVENLTIR